MQASAHHFHLRLSALDLNPIRPSQQWSAQRLPCAGSFLAPLPSQLSVMDPREGMCSRRCWVHTVFPPPPCTVPPRLLCPPSPSSKAP